MKEKGYTLLELLLVISITGVIVAVIGASIVQIMQGKRVDISQQATALTDIDSATQWLVRDLALAQTTSLVDGAQPTSNVTVSWIDTTAWALDEGTTDHEASYRISGTQLLRDYDGEETIVGRYMNNISFSLAGDTFTVTLTSRPGLQSSEVTRSFLISSRSGLD
ncbi:MAG: type II secretion system protein [Dehalococcoidales bacterium]|nr:type II secretion system protein [Dehalococcoidales bacterium]